MNPILTAIDEIASWEGPNMRWLRGVNLSAGMISGEDESRLPSEGCQYASGDHAPASGASGCSSNLSEESDRG
jgi:hypothetical protein